MGGYSLPLKNRDMFRDLKKGFQVYTLDTSDVPVFRMGNVVNVSEPRFQQPQMGQMGQYQQLQDRVIDLTVEINGSSMTYVVPESRDVAMSNNITLACSVDPIMNQLNAAKRTSSDILDSIDKHRRTLEACDSILEEINPAFKQTKDQDRKIKNLEEKVDRMGSSFDSLAHAQPEHEALLGRMMMKVPQIAAEAGLSNGFKTQINTGKGGGQEVFHLHIHIMGRPA